jgi:NAD(P)-dependent dehydrogenase (short-subunit alcohol dehydrogenase family)
MASGHRFAGKTVVVTGAARGIGREIARQALAEGGQVAMVGRTLDGLESARLGFSEGGDRAFCVQCDVSDPDQIQTATDAVMERCGRIDVLVNNAAINSYVRPENVTRERWRLELDVCLSGPFFFSQAVGIASMIPNKSGSIVNVGSGASLAGLPRCSPYVAAKHGLVGLTRALAVDWGQFNIRVNCVCPGLTFTDLSQAMADKDPEMMRQRELRIPLSKGARPDEVARTVLFVASDEAFSINGIALPLDGGTNAMSSGFSPPRDQI